MRLAGWSGLPRLGRLPVCWVFHAHSSCWWAAMSLPLSPMPVSRNCPRDSDEKTCSSTVSPERTGTASLLCAKASPSLCRFAFDRATFSMPRAINTAAMHSVASVKTMATTYTMYCSSSPRSAAFVVRVVVVVVVVAVVVVAAVLAVPKVVAVVVVVVVVLLLLLARAPPPPPPRVGA